MRTRRLVRALEARRLAIVAIFLITAAIAVGVYIFTPKTYSSTVLLFVSARPVASTDAAYQGAQLSAQRITTYSQLLQSEPMASRIKNRSGSRLSQNTISSSISVKNTIDTVILQTTVTTNSQEESTRIAAAVATEFPAYVAEIEKPRSPGVDPPTIVRPIWSPTTTGNPTSLSLADYLAFALTSAVAVVLLWGWLISLRDPTIDGEDDIAMTVGSAPLASIPTEPKVKDESHTSTSDLEPYRILRTAIAFASVDRSLGILLVTSPGAGEGKSTVSIRLASVFAQLGLRVLLIDADLRRPTVASRLGLSGEAGLSVVLSGRLLRVDAVQRSKFAEIDVMTAGTNPPNPSELLGSTAMETLLAECRKNYDLVIVDSAPLLPVTDSAALANFADGVVVVARNNATKASELTRAQETLKAVNVNPLGVVLNGVGRAQTTGENRSASRFRAAPNASVAAR